MLKLCSKCRINKSITDFSKNSTMKDGYSHYCKKCAGEATLKSRNKDREKILASNKRYYKKHREEKIKYSQTYYKSNINHMRQVSKDWSKKHPQKRLLINANRRARKASAPGKFTLEDFEKQYILQGGKCYYCNVKTKLTIEHQIPLSRGGSNWPKNIVLACRSCNSKKSIKMPEEFLAI